MHCAGEAADKQAGPHFAERRPPWYLTEEEDVAPPPSTVPMHGACDTAGLPHS